MINFKGIESMSIVIMIMLFLFVGFLQSWTLSLSILNMCIISEIMSMGINMQWGYAGIFNVGIMGFTALGGLAAVLISYSPIGEAWKVGGKGMIVSLVILIITVLWVLLLTIIFVLRMTDASSSLVTGDDIISIRLKVLSINFLFWRIFCLLQI